MLRTQWDQIIAVMVANWPHSPPEDASIDKWFLDLQGFPAEQVYAAVETFNREGERFPPTGGQLCARLAELGHDDPDHGEAWELMNQARWKWGIYGGPEGRRGDSQPIAWLEERSPAVAETCRRIGWLELCLTPTDQEATLRAQFREIYKSAVVQRKRERAWKGLPSAGLKALERIADGQPRKIAVRPVRPELTQGGASG